MGPATVTHLVTHSGAFHSDEVCAYVVLSALFPGSQLVRTRDADRISELDGHAVIFDVGDVYDPERGRFDHHQPGRLLRPDSEVPYSSFGLVWRHFGADYLAGCLGISPHVAGEVAAEVDRDIVLTIDAIDNGIVADDHAGAMHSLSLPALVLDQRPDFDDDDPLSETRGFLDAAHLARQILEARIRSVAARLRGREIIEQAMASRSDPRWLKLPRAMPYEETVHAAGDDSTLFVVNPARDEWQLNTVPRVPGRYGARKYLPAPWGGLRGAPLADVTGVADAVFCHSQRFIAVTRSREGAIRLLEKALEA